MDTAHDRITELEDGIEKLSQDPGGKKRQAGENEKKWREWKMDPDIPIFLLAMIQKGEWKECRRQTQRRSKEIISRIGKGHASSAWKDTQDCREDVRKKTTSIHNVRSLRTQGSQEKS